MRRVCRPLSAWDVGARSLAGLEPGAILSAWKVSRVEGDDPYLVHFESGGRQYTCPLFRFQPRTETAEAPAAHETIPARDAAGR